MMAKLEKDNRWDGWPAVDEEYFDALGNRLTLRPEVPPAIFKQYDMIRSALRFCYYDYELTSVVFLLLGIAFDAAVNIRFKQLGGKLPRKKHRNLKNLIDWGLENHLFEEDVVSLHALRKIRNLHAHQMDPVLFGIAGMQSIGLTTDIINGVFDPRTELREKRLVRVARINRIFELFGSHGMILSWNDLRIIAFKAKLLVNDNFKNPGHYHIAVWPIFKIDSESDQVDAGSPVRICCDSISFSKYPERKIILGDGSLLTGITKSDDKEKFEQWQEVYKASKFQLEQYINIRLAEMRRALMSEKIYTPI